MQTMLSEWLSALGFTRMANDVLVETDMARLRKYAHLILKNLPEADRRNVFNRFVMLRLV